MKNNIEDAVKGLMNSPKWESLDFSQRCILVTKITELCDFYKEHGMADQISKINSEWILARINQKGIHRMAKIDKALELAYREAEEKNLLDMEAEKNEIRKYFQE